MEIDQPGLCGVSPRLSSSRRAARTALVAVIVASCGPSATAWAFATTSPDQRGAETTQKVAAISGKVEDPSGAVIAGATVSLTPTGAGERYETTTDPNGVYHFERVPEGSYLALVFRVESIALRLGFSSSSHLSSAFRQRIGCSPTEFRKRYAS